MHPTGFLVFASVKLWFLPNLSWYQMGSPQIIPNVGFCRQGIARYLLSCCEQISATKGMGDMSLHVRLADPSARALYTSDGFSEQDRDFFLSSLRGMRPRALLTKKL